MTSRSGRVAAAAIALVAFGVTVVPLPVGATRSTAGAESPSADAAPSVGLRLVDAPASAVDDPRAQIYIVDHLAPGTTIERRIEVSSTASETTRVELYSGAASIEGTSFTGAPEGRANDLSSWTTLGSQTVAVAPGGTALATVTVDVPADAAPGEQYAVVWAQVSAPPAQGSGGIGQVSRVGIRMYISVGPGGPPAADFEVQSLSAGRDAEGAPVVTASVTNTGGRALDLSGTLQLANGPGELQAGPFPVSVGTTLAIGDTESVEVEMDRQVPAGPWDAQLDLRSGNLERSGRATITFPDSDTAPPRPTTSSGGRRPLVLALAVLAIAWCCWLLWRRHERRAWARSTERDRDRPRRRKGADAGTGSAESDPATIESATPVGRTP